jgi:hypothetical protein
VLPGGRHPGILGNRPIEERIPSRRRARRRGREGGGCASDIAPWRPWRGVAWVGLKLRVKRGGPVVGLLQPKSIRAHYVTSIFFQNKNATSILSFTQKSFSLQMAGHPTTLMQK